VRGGKGAGVGDFDGMGERISVVVSKQKLVCSFCQIRSRRPDENIFERSWAWPARDKVEEASAGA